MITRLGKPQCETSRVSLCSAWTMLDQQPKTAAMHNTMVPLLQMPSTGKGTAPLAGVLG